METCRGDTKNEEEDLRMCHDEELHMCHDEELHNLRELEYHNHHGVNHGTPREEEVHTNHARLVCYCDGIARVHGTIRDVCMALAEHDTLHRHEEVRGMNLVRGEVWVEVPCSLRHFRNTSRCSCNHKCRGIH
mgnify:CR=1 FL=1